jgi:hypothetical protein
MSGEPFDSGAVLTRARPVLTFTTAVRTGGSTVAAGGAPSVGAPANAPRAVAARGRARIDTPTPGGVSLPGVALVRPRGASLPVIARIVRDGSLDAGPFAALSARVAAPLASILRSLQRSGAGMMVVGALGLATLGAIAGLGMRSLSDEASTATTVTGGVAPSVDPMATEQLFARAPLADRVDRAGTTSLVEPPVPSPAPAPAPAHALAASAGVHAPAHAPSKAAHAPSHAAPRAFAAAHASKAVARRATSPSALARR